MAPGSLALIPSDMMLFPQKTAGQNFFYPVDLHPDIRERKARYLGNSGCIHLLQVGQHDLTVQRFQLLNELEQLLERPTLVDIRLTISTCECLVYIFKTYEKHTIAALSVYVGDRRIVRNAKGPGLQRTPSIESPEAPPKLKVDLLPQIVALLPVAFIPGSQPVE
jgi:hypothetical protein